MNLSYHIVDVFAEQRFSGNQLAVFLDTGDLPEDVMQQIASEMHFSETTFLGSREQHNGGYDVRIFTPAEELPFAGHPTLGTAAVIREFVQETPAELVKLNLKVGQIPVRYDQAKQIYRMHQKSPEFGQIIDAERVAQVIDLSPEDIDKDFPVQIVSTGIPFIIAPLTSLGAVKKARLNFGAYPDALRGLETGAILLFAPETEKAENDLHVRVFAEYYGVTEDPATGSANGCLAGYLAKHQYFGSEAIGIAVEQGFEIGRPSRLFLRTSMESDQIQVHVGGNVIPVARGTLEL